MSSAEVSFYTFENLDYYYTVYLYSHSNLL
jgi:hypothetical protein